MRRAGLVAVALCACVTAPVLPAPFEVAAPTIRFRMQDFVLPSGLRILIQEDHSSPVVVVVNVVGVGHAHDSVGKEGTAHFLEHLTFRARGEGEPTHWTMLERIGAGEFNATTQADVTTYYAAGAREVLPDLLRLEAARIANPLRGVDEAAFETEREVVRNELRERTESGTSARIWNWLRAAVFPASFPYAHPPNGTHETLSQITFADVSKLAKLYYRPDNMTMMIAGDLDLDKMREVLNATLPPEVVGDPKNPTRPPQRRLLGEAADPPITPPHAIYRYRAGVDKPELWLGWALPGGHRPDSVLEDFVKELAGTLRYAKRKDKDIDSITVDTDTGTRATLLVCRVQLKEGTHPDESANAVLDQLSETWKISGFALQIWSRYAANALALGMEDLVERAKAGAIFTHFTGNPKYLARSNEAIVTLGADVVTDFTKRYLQRDRVRIVYVEPDGSHSNAISAARRSVGEQANPKADTLTTHEQLAHAEQEPTHSTEDLLRIARPPGFSGLLVTTLPNGLEVAVARRRGLPTVTAALALHGGSAAGQPHGIAEVAEESTYPADKEHLPAFVYGAQPVMLTFKDLVLHAMLGFSTALEPVIGLLSDEVSERKVSDSIADAMHEEKTLVELRKLEQKPSVRAMHGFWRALFGAHPYASAASADDFAQIGHRAVQRWIDRAYHPRNAVLAISGDIDDGDAVRFARKWFGTWKGDSDGGLLAAPPSVSTAPRPAQVQVTGLPGSTHADIVLGCLLPTAAEDREAADQLLAQTIMRHLLRRLRHELAATYDVGTYAKALRGGTEYLLLTTSVDNAKLPAVLHEIAQYWTALATTGPDPAEVDAARWDLARAFNLRFANNPAVIGEILERRNRGWSLAGVDEYPKRLVATKAEDLRTLFQTCRDTQVLAVIGEEAIVRGAVREGWEK